METPSLSHSVNSTVLFPVLTAFLETTLNHLLYRETVLKSARIRLAGKVLSIELKEIEIPLILVFSEKQVDVLSQWSESADCSMKTTLPALLKLRDRQCLSSLINSGEIIIEGDMQVIQQWSALLDMLEWDPAHYLSPYVGDIVAEGFNRVVKNSIRFACNTVSRQKNYLSESLTEEWKMTPGALELAYFSEEVDAVANKLSDMEKRLAAMEKKYDAQ
ncbi:SCP2 domain-containing protein [Xenorhabdus sp. PB61.4]|uniref:ubiquinone biosynthesis protein UbiJ n=1 Tax=Xenorhabdus sp. PB61.4 TaxID=2788940 RepID=UPI001E5F0A21|nr:SCP2 domain-containing protein [Xenorhabdus sp. PB61.4]MCC8364878.1 SCP2 domain-containing protein [Xenorhabdus sp. PB61.4]